MEIKQNPAIKFSHVYDKIRFLEGNVVLLQAIKINYLELSKEMIEYDTHYGYDENYKLPETELIILIFKCTQSFRIFTTIRRYTPEKYVYYKAKQGCVFDIIIEGESQYF